ncbi:hypothetical protein [Sulfurospirillum oryzae]|uniref:hypothetical protein n=1 Tax=Sulfurospirillum oryzae TaxID=2976535 RepID=UPI0021E8219E|nr:hypothetical protein [Sulfurospirillum oryzae]
MLEQNLMTIQQYAIKHKMSTFAVLKLVNAKKLKTIKKRVDNQEHEYIIDETISSNKPAVINQELEALESPEQGKSIDYEIEFHKLLAKYIDLQEKYAKLIEETK